MWAIYAVRNKVNGKQYVGQTKQDPEVRWRYHRSTPKQFELHRDMAFFGKQQFSMRVLQYCTTKEVANAAEIRWIKKLRTMAPLGYNMIRPPLTDKAREKENLLLLANLIRDRRIVTGLVMLGGRERQLVNGKWQGPWRNSSSKMQKRKG
ncbi:MAG: GIY-YIG nuclease family protein [Nitrospirota bacterium]